MKRKLGRSNIEISALGMGCWAIGGPFWDEDGTPLGWGEVSDDESIRAIYAALDLGVNFFDTANVYGAGHSERVLAKAFKGKRDKVVIASKFNAIFNEETRIVTGGDSSPAAIRQACEDSLRRLNTDYIDLYQFHDNEFPPEKAQPVRNTLEELVKEGKIRTYGWSTDFPESAEVFVRGENCSAIQLQLNVLEDNAPVLEICEQHDQAAINRGPLAMGLLTGKYNLTTKVTGEDVRSERSPAWLSYFEDGKPNPEFLARVNAVREILTSESRSIAQGSLAWLWARSEVTIPIPGFRTVQQVEDNAGAMEKGPLTLAQFAEIEELLRPVKD